MKIIVPLCVIAARPQAIGVVLLILQHQMDMSFGQGSANFASHPVEKIIILDGVDRVEAQPVDAIVAQPHQSIVDEKRCTGSASTATAPPQGV